MLIEIICDPRELSRFEEGQTSVACMFFLHFHGKVNFFIIIFLDDHQRDLVKHDFGMTVSCSNDGTNVFTHTYRPLFI